MGVPASLGTAFKVGDWTGTTNILAQVEWLDLSDQGPGYLNPTGPVTMTVGFANGSGSLVNAVTRIVTPVQNPSRSATSALTVAGEIRVRETGSPGHETVTFALG